MARGLTISDIFPQPEMRVRVERKPAARIVTGAFSLDCDARKEAGIVSLSLPYPPAGNNLFFNVPGRGRVKSSRYTQWLTEAGWMLAEQKPGRVMGEYEADIIAYRPDKRRRDLDGIIKPLLDCLVAYRVTGDDSLARKITIAWADGGDGVAVTVRPFEVAR